MVENASDCMLDFNDDVIEDFDAEFVEIFDEIFVTIGDVLSVDVDVSLIIGVCVFIDVMSVFAVVGNDDWKGEGLLSVVVIGSCVDFAALVVVINDGARVLEADNIVVVIINNVVLVSVECDVGINVCTDVNCDVFLMVGDLIVFVVIGTSGGCDIFVVDANGSIVLVSFNFSVVLRNFVEMVVKIDDSFILLVAFDIFWDVGVGLCVSVDADFSGMAGGVVCVLTDDVC